MTRYTTFFIATSIAFAAIIGDGSSTFKGTAGWEQKRMRVPVHALSILPPPRSLAHNQSKPPYWTRTAIERSFSSETETVPPPAMLPFTATKTGLAPFPSGIWLPAVGTTGAPAVVPAAAAFQLVTQLDW